jgi:hypothetical protein
VRPFAYRELTMKKQLIFMAAVAAVTISHARLGESIEECRARYGEPRRIQTDDSLSGIATYAKNDLVIAVHFDHGKADLIRYSPGQVSTIDLELARYLLQLNGRNKEWDQLTRTSIVLQEFLDQNIQYPREEMVDPILWKSKDGILEASYSVSKGMFEVKSSTFEEKIRQGL